MPRKSTTNGAYLGNYGGFDSMLSEKQIMRLAFFNSLKFSPKDELLIEQGSSCLSSHQLIRF
jgi:hypothetical protein